MIQAFADALKGEVRTMNLAARYGGDEFVALLSDTDAVGARRFIDRVRRSYAERTAEIGRGPVTVSAGLATYRDDMPDANTLLREADRALYREKPGTST